MLLAAAPAVAAPVADATCTLRAPVPGRDDWCERWVSTTSLLPSSLAVTDDGARTYASGRALSDGSWVVAVVDNADGRTIRSFPVAADVEGMKQTHVASMRLDPANEVVYVAGWVQGRTETEAGFENFTRAWAAAYTGFGERLWQTVHSSGAGLVDAAVSMVLSADGGTIAVMGMTFSESSSDLLTLTLDAESGAVRWHERLGGEGRWWGGSLAVSNDGNRVYAVSLRGHGFVDVIAYRGAAALPPGVSRLAWIHRSETDEFLYARGGVAVSEDGSRVAVSGYDLRHDRLRMAALVLDRDGNAVWHSSVPAQMPQVYAAVNLDEPSAEVTVRQVATDAVPLHLALTDDAVVLGGFQLEWDAQYGVTTPAPALSSSTAVLDLEDGKLQWQRSHRAETDRIFYPTHLSARGGRVTVGGIASDCNFFFRPPAQCSTEIGYSTLTVAYDQASGELTKAARYNQTAGVPSGLQPSPFLGTSFDITTASALGPDGSLVTGAWSTGTSLCPSCELGSTSVLFSYGP